MKNSLTVAIVSVVLGFAAGYFVSTQLASEKSKPAFLVGAVEITDFERLPEYRAQAEPLARHGGYRVLASGNTDTSNAQLIEGEWPAQGLLFIEQYDSMQDLLEFVNSEAFQALKPLRDQVADVHFMFALSSGENINEE